MKNLTPPSPNTDWGKLFEDTWNDSRAKAVATSEEKKDDAVKGTENGPSKVPPSYLKRRPKSLTSSGASTSSLDQNKSQKKVEQEAKDETSSVHFRGENISSPVHDQSHPLPSIWDTNLPTGSKAKTSATTGPDAQDLPRIGLSSLAPYLPPGKHDDFMGLINTHIRNMGALSPEVKKRYAPTVSFTPRKPSSEQYQYAKDRIPTAAERTLVSAGLEEIVKGGNTGAGIDRDKALELWLAVQHARLRSHTREQRGQYHAVQSRWQTMNVLFSPTLVWPMTGIQQVRDTRKDYHRTEQRPEYGQAFNAFMEMLNSPDIRDEHKRTIAQALLDQHIRKEGTIAPDDVNNLIAALPGGQRRPAHGHTVSKAPAPTADDSALYQAIIDLAKSGYRHDPQRRANARRRAAMIARMEEDRRRQLAEARRAQPLGGNMSKAIDEANKLLAANNLPPIPPLKTENAFDRERNAGAFSRILELIEDPGNETARRQVTTAVRNELYLNAGMIIAAITRHSDLRQRIFDQSVGGLAHCNNNVLEVFSRLSATVRNYLMEVDIRAGKLSPQDYAKAGIQKFRLETIENFVTLRLIPGRERDTLHVQPEMSLRLKSELKDDFGLPDSVTKVTVPYWVPRTGDIDHCKRYVTEKEADAAAVSAFFDADPEWRGGTIALTEQYNPEDALLLHAYTRMDDFKETGGRVRHKATKTDIDDPSVMLARKAWDDLNSIYRPSDEHGKYKDLCERIDNLAIQFGEARRDVERQLASHVTRCLLPDKVNNPPVKGTACLPPDGQFKPAFKLPPGWDSQIQSIKAQAADAERVEMKEKRAAKANEIKSLEDQIGALKANHADLVGTSDQEIEAALDKMAQRQKLRAQGIDPGENTSPPSDGLIKLNALIMQRDKLQDELKTIDEDLNGLK